MQALRIVAFLAVCATAVPAVAKTIVVVPGPGTPLQDAIDAAAPGDRLKVQSGTYAEAIAIDKPLVVVGPLSIDAGCAVPSAVTITADRVQLRGVAIRGGSSAAVTVSGADRVTLMVGAYPTCPGVQRAISAEQTTRLLVKKSSTYAWDVTENIAADCASPLQQGERQFAEAAVVVASAPAAAGNRIQHSTFCNPRTGVLVTGSAGSPKGQPALKIQSSGLYYANDGGVTLQDADDVAIVGNLIYGPIGLAPTGIALDATSDDNVIQGNVIEDFVQDVQDLGTRNCWRRNTYETGLGSLGRLPVDPVRRPPRPTAAECPTGSRSP